MSFRKYFLFLLVSFFLLVAFFFGSCNQVRASCPIGTPPSGCSLVREDWYSTGTAGVYSYSTSLGDCTPPVSGFKNINHKLCVCKCMVDLYSCPGGVLPVPGGRKVEWSETTGCSLEESIPPSNSCAQSSSNCNACCTEYYLPSPTPTKIPCNGVCTGAGDSCSTNYCNMNISPYRCRNYSCPSVTNCVCPTNTPTPSRTPTPTRTPTPKPTNTPTPTPTPTPTCPCDEIWQDDGCNSLGCNYGERVRYQYCYELLGDGRRGQQCKVNIDCQEDDTCLTSWFQTQEGNVHAKEDIYSKIPSGEKFSLDGVGGYPGVVSYGGEVNFGSGEVSSKNWLANTSLKNIFNYDYFYALLGKPTLSEGGEISLPDDKDIVAYSGNVKTGSNWNVGTRKMVVFIEGKFLINNLVNVDIANGGSLLVVARGGIGVNKNVSTIKGFFFTDGEFYSSVKRDFMIDNFDPVDSDIQLTIIGGAMAANFNLNRDLGSASNQTTPAEKFVYSPDLVMNLPLVLWRRQHLWEEVAP